MDALVQPILDIIYFFEWLISSIGQLLSYISGVVSHVWQFFLWFFSIFLNPPATNNLWIQNNIALNFLTGLPLWSALVGVITGLLVLGGMLAIIKIIKL